MPDLVPIGASELRVSRIALGTFNFGHQPSGSDEETSLAIVRRYLELGHNYIDTANVYGEGRAETYVGKAIAGRRHEVVLASKAGGVTGPGPLERGTSREALTLAIEASLRRLGTDYLDLYQMHVWDPLTPLEETLETLDGLVRAGKIRYAGVSNWTAAQIVDAVRLCQMHGWAPIVSLQPQYNPLQRDIEVDIIPTCRRFGLGVVTWSPLAGGLLAGLYRRNEEPAADSRLATFPGMRARLTEATWDKIEAFEAEAERLGTSPAGLALAWNLKRLGVTAPIMGPQTVEQLEANLAALDLDVPDETMRRIDALNPPAVPYPHGFGQRR